ncbi:MAG: hypothetical protein LAN70_02155 [Acidobacteriia bacterium]|nr:hypothetical protein [Terriglobia bacterium]
MAAIPKTRENFGIGRCSRTEDLDAELRRLISRMIKDSPKKRKEIAAEMSVRLPRPVSESMLNDFTRPGKKAARFPAVFVPVFSQVVGDDRLQRYLLGPRLRKLLDFAERELRARSDQRERDRLRRELLQEDGKP